MSEEHEYTSCLVVNNFGETFGNFEEITQPYLFPKTELGFCVCVGVCSISVKDDRTYTLIQSEYHTNSSLVPKDPITCMVSHWGHNCIFDASRS